MKIRLLAAYAALGTLGAATPAHAGSDPLLGEIMLVGFTFCPRGWTEADGQLLSISSNGALFSLYGTTYGGDGRTTFALPDLRGRAPIHTGEVGRTGTENPMGKRTTDAKVAPATEGSYADVPGSLVMRYCVATQGVYPSRN